MVKSWAVEHKLVGLSPESSYFIHKILKSRTICNTPLPGPKFVNDPLWMFVLGEPPIGPFENFRQFCNIICNKLAGLANRANGDMKIWHRIG